MSDSNIRTCDGPNCDYAVEQEQPRTVGSVGYYDFHEIQTAEGRFYHFHTFNCLATYVAEKMGWTERAN